MSPSGFGRTDRTRARAEHDSDLAIEEGPARRFLLTLRGRPLAVSIVTVEEVLEGAADEAQTFAALQRFNIQGLHLAQARRCALLQRRASRRMARTTRGWWPRPSPSKLTSWQLIGRRSNASVPATFAFAERQKPGFERPRSEPGMALDLE